LRKEIRTRTRRKKQNHAPDILDARDLCTEKDEGGKFGEIRKVPSVGVWVEV